MSKELFDLMAEKGRAALDNDSVYAVYQNLPVNEKRLADLMAEKGRAALDNDSVYAVYQNLPESKKITSNESKSPSLTETIFPRITSESEKTPIQTLWSGIKDVSSLPGRVGAEGIGLLGDVVGTIAGSMNMKPEDRRKYLDEELGKLVTTSPERISNIGDDKNYGGIYNFAKGIATDPLAPAYLAIGGINPSTASMATKLGIAGARAIGTASLPLIDIGISEKRIPTAIETVLALGSGIAPELFNIKGMRTEVAKEQLKNAEQIVEFAKKRLRSAEQSGEAVRTMRAEDANPSEPIDVSLTPREQSAKEFLESKRKEASEKAGKFSELTSPVNPVDIATGGAGYVVGGPLGMAVAPIARRVVKSGEISGPVLRPTLQQIIASGIDQFNKGKISRSDMTAISNAAESIRINPNDSTASKILQEHYNRFMK